MLPSVSVKAWGAWRQTAVTQMCSWSSEDAESIVCKSLVSSSFQLNTKKLCACRSYLSHSCCVVIIWCEIRSLWHLNKFLSLQQHRLSRRSHRAAWWWICWWPIRSPNTNHLSSSTWFPGHMKNWMCLDWKVTVSVPIKALSCRGLWCGGHELPQAPHGEAAGAQRWGGFMVRVIIDCFYRLREQIYKWERKEERKSLELPRVWKMLEIKPFVANFVVCGSSSIPPPSAPTNWHKKWYKSHPGATGGLSYCPLLDFRIFISLLLLKT